MVVQTETTRDTHQPQSARFVIVVLIAFLAVLGWSAIRPHDYFTWFLEVAPALIGLAVLAVTYPRFRFTNLVYALICVQAMILCVGGHYTYAREPIFSWIRDHWHLSRNYYDRVGHFAQGFVPAMIAREVFIRRRIVKRGAWMFFVVVCLCLAISAAYELVEWRVAVGTGSRADDFLGTQGDNWDTQEDMATALAASVIALITLGRVHDRLLRQYEPETHVMPVATC
jgi:putative membrane protein